MTEDTTLRLFTHLGRLSEIEKGGPPLAPSQKTFSSPAQAWVDSLSRFSDLPCLCDTNVIVRGGQRTGSLGVDGVGLGGQLNQSPYDGCSKGGRVT